MSAASAGGAAGASGVGLQNRVFGWAAAAVVAERPLPRDGLVAGVAVRVGAQTGHEMDDVVVQTDSGNFVLFQVKAGLSLGKTAESPLGKALAQAVTQYVTGRLRCADGAERAVDPFRDALVVCTNSSAPQSVRIHLAAAVDRTGHQPPGTPLGDGLSVDEMPALTVVLSHVRRVWQRCGPAMPDDEQLRGFLRALRVMTVDAESGETGHAAATAMLSAVLLDGQSATRAWLVLVAEGQAASERRQWRDRADLVVALSQHNVRVGSRALLEVPGEDAFLSLDTFAADRRRPDTVLNDLGPRVGREQEMQELRAALNGDADRAPVVIVTGPGGRGKTRLLVEALTEQQQARRDVPILCLSPGRTVDTAALGELPQLPALIVVDDAHRDPAAVAPLLYYARRVDGMQLVFSTRPPGIAALRTQILQAGHRTSSVRTVEVGELSRPEARTLVDSLMKDLGVRAPVREYFTGQAVDSPYVAVIAADLIRRGELTAPIVVDAGLREQILARYEELAAGELDGVPGSTVRRVLAVYAALGPLADQELYDQIAGFCDITRSALLGLRNGLRVRGVLVTRGGLTRVVPDMLADDLLDRQAAVGEDDTGFADELWETFHGTHAERLIVSLAELDWRLTRSGGPLIMGPVWEAVRIELRDADNERLCRLLDVLGPLATTQPLDLVAVLDEVRARLDTDEAAPGSADLETSEEQEESGDSAPDRDDAGAGLWDWGGRLFDVDDVRERLPVLYGQCAIAAPNLLESALDVLWAFARQDVRPVGQYSEHALRVITGRWANLTDLPHPSFPARIVERVGRWLAEPGGDQDVVTPLAVLHPLIVKESEQHFMDHGRLILRSEAVSVSWARPVRDTIRTMLLEQACGADLRRAAAAIELVGEMLRRPIGHLGRTVERDEVLAWEDDDLATVDVARRIGETTTSAVVRRLLRAAIAWNAERAMSLPLRHAALTVLTFLDGFDDDLTELLMPSHGSSMPSRRHLAVPTLDELRAAVTARAEQDRELSDEEREAARSADLDARVQQRLQAPEQLAERVVPQLVAVGPPSRIVAFLDATCREIRAARPDTRPSLWGLWRGLGLARPDLLPTAVQAITNNPAGPLDQDLGQLLDVWAQHDEPGLVAWLTNLTGQRQEVRVAVGVAFANHGWTDRGPRFRDVYHVGVSDTDRAVREQFLKGGHRLLVTDPAATVAQLLAVGITPAAATFVLEQACFFDGASWGRGLDRADAQAVLDLVGHADWENWTLQQLLSGIAENHPALVLNHLAARQARQPTPPHIEGLAAAFARHAAVVMRWLVEHARDEQASDISGTIALVTAGNLTTEQVEQLDPTIDDLEEAALPALIAALRDLSTWPLRQPGLARRLLARARQVGDDTATRARIEIAEAMQLWAGETAELHRARAAAAACADNEADPQLREDFDNARAYYDELIAWAADDDQAIEPAS